MPVEPDFGECCPQVVEAPDYAAAAWFAYRRADDTGALGPFEFQVQVAKFAGASSH